MGQVTVRIGGYTHPVSCEDGQEGHLIALAAEVDRNVGAVRAMAGQHNEARLLLLAALLLADRVHDLGADLNRRQGAAPAPAAPAGPPPKPGPDPALLSRLAEVVERIEGIAAAMEHP